MGLTWDRSNLADMYYSKGKIEGKLEGQAEASANAVKVYVQARFDLRPEEAEEIASRAKECVLVGEDVLLYVYKASSLEQVRDILDQAAQRMAKPKSPEQ